MNQELSWMIKVRSLCLLAMMQSLKATDATIRKVRKLLLAEMSDLMKTNVGIGSTKKTITIFFQFLKKIHIRLELMINNLLRLQIQLLLMVMRVLQAHLKGQKR